MFELSNPKQEFFKRLVIFAFSFLLVFTAFYSLKGFVRVWNINSYENYLNSLYEIKKEKGLSALVEINADCVAYIECDDLDVHLPIVELKNEEDENFYLTHDFKKNKNELGTPYQKYGTYIGVTSNTALVGHSAFTRTINNKTVNQSIFGKFNNYLYKNSSYNYEIKVDTLNNSYTYKVISVIMFYANNLEAINEFKLYNTVNITTQSEFDQFYNTAKDRSMISGLDTANFGDKFLTIMTCSTEDLDYRVMVIAKQI